MPALLSFGALLWALLPWLATGKARRAALVVYAWNAHNAPPANLDRLVKSWLAEGADLVALNEVWTRRSTLDRLARARGLRHYQEQVGPRTGAVVSEAGSTAVLVGPGVKVLKRRVIVLDRSWVVFSARRRHDGRRLERLRVSKAGQVYKVTVVHGPTNGPTGGNRFAYAEFIAALVRAAKVKPRVVSVIVGDFNAKLGWLKPWAKARDAKAAGHNVDAAVVAGGTVRRQKLSKSGSDHAAIRYEIRSR